MLTNNDLELDLTIIHEPEEAGLYQGDVLEIKQEERA